MPYKDKEKAKEYHREYNRVYMRESYARNPRKHLDRDATWRENNPSKRLIFSTRSSAKKKNLEHNIDTTDLQLPELCPYTGLKIDYTAGNGKTMLKPSVDRINPALGYIKGNVEVISSLANTMKSKADVRTLQNFALEVLKRYPLDDSFT